jgi:transcriptional regulator GlxA family with amidase domain
MSTSTPTRSTCATARSGRAPGTDVSQLIARWLVMFLHRPGGQTQFATPVWVRRAERSPVRQAQAQVEAAPEGDHRVAVLAESASMSERHFTRVFTAEVGETPSRFVERVRTEAARRELESTRDTLDVIASRCGFGTTETLRRTFHRRLRISPDAYRRRFATTAASAPTTGRTSS